MNKLSTILCVVTIIIHFLPYNKASSDIQEVRLVSPGNHIRMHDDHTPYYPVLKYEPLKIIFEKINAANIKCWQAYERNKSFVESNNNNLNYNNEHSILQIYNVTSNMSTKWECDIIHNDSNPNDLRTTYYFNIRVKNAKEINVSIGGIPIIFERTNLSVTDYDGIYEHMCEVGETVDFTCKNIYKEGKLMMRYSDAEGKEVFKTEYLTNTQHIDHGDRFNTMLSFRMSMRAENDSSYIDCTYEYTSINVQEFTYRTKFTIKNEILPSNYTVTINDKKLYGIDKYHYKFINGEKLKVSCENRVPDFGHIYVTIIRQNGSHFNVTTEPHSMPGMATFYISTMSLDGAVVQCYAKLNTFFMASITLYEDTDRDPIIFGLPESGILYQYSKNNVHWIAHYQYTLYETLSLTCTSRTTRTLFWSVRGKSELPSKGSLSPKYKNIDLNGTYNEIICEAKMKNIRTRKMIVRLHQKTKESQLLYGDTDESTIIIIASCVAGILVAIITAVCVYYWCKKNRNSNAKQRPYENFKNTDSPIPASPSQWENNEYTYIINNGNNYETNENNDMVENSLYESSNVVNKRITASSAYTENPYTEIDDYRNNTMPKYSVPYEEHAIRNKGIIINSGPTENFYSEIGDSTTPEYAEPYEQREIRNRKI